MGNNQEIATAYISGLSLSQTAEKFGVLISRVRSALRSTGTATRARNCGIGKKPEKHKGKRGPDVSRHRFSWEEAAELYKCGSSLSKIANRFSVTSENVRYALSQMGIARRSRGAGIGKENHQFKGGENLLASGYIVRRGSREKQHQHRAIAEKAIGRPLLSSEVVHHINCIKSDNRPENLLICTQEYHMQLHARMRKDPYWSAVESHAKTITYHQ